jgi:hypothetical protein
MSRQSNNSISDSKGQEYRTRARLPQLMMLARFCKNRKINRANQTFTKICKETYSKLEEAIIFKEGKSRLR